MPKFFRATSPELIKLLEEIDAHQATQAKTALALSRKYGGSRTEYLTSTGFFGDASVVGFKIKEENVDKALFKRAKGMEDGWLPRAVSKEAKALQKRLRALTGTHFSELQKLLGMQAFGRSAIGSDMVARRPGIQKVGDEWIVVVPDDCPGHGCERIADVEYEMLVEQENKARRKAKAAAKRKRQRAKAKPKAKGRPRAKS